MKAKRDKQAEPAKKPQPHEMGNTYVCEKCKTEVEYGYPCQCGWTRYEMVKTQAFPKGESR